MSRLLLVLLVPLLCLGAAAGQESRPSAAPAVAKPFLWKVQGNGLKTDSWLFGTIHLGGDGVTKLHPASNRAFLASDVLYTEIPMDAGSIAQLPKLFARQDGRTLSGAIGERLALDVDVELKAINPQLGVAAFESCKTWAVAQGLPSLRSQLAGEKTLDLLLWNRAVATGKKTYGLETAKSQTDVFDRLKEEEQIGFLIETLRRQKRERQNGHDDERTLRTLYLAGEEEPARKFIRSQLDDSGQHPEIFARLTKALLNDRNRSLAATMAACMSKTPQQSHFFAVGLAHYIGATSIRTELEAKGFRVTRVTE